MTTTLDPELDLVIQRVIKASPQRIWTAWTTPDLLAQWWVPPPTIAQIDLLDVRPGGGFVTRMSDDGSEFVPHTDGIFLVVEEERRLVFTNAIDSSWHPASPAPVSLTAEIVFDEHPEGTAYRAVVRHGNPTDRAHHQEIGFFDGWGAVTEALAALTEM